MSPTGRQETKTKSNIGTILMMIGFLLMLVLGMGYGYSLSMFKLNTYSMNVAKGIELRDSTRVNQALVNMAHLDSAQVVTMNQIDTLRKEVALNKRAIEKNKELSERILAGKTKTK